MIDKDKVKYIASLSRLNIPGEDIPRFAGNLEAILHYVEKLNSVDVSAIKPTSHVLEVENVFREDKVLPSLTQTEALRFAIESHAGHYKVPKVIE